MKETVPSVSAMQKACTDRNNNQNVYKYIFLVGQDCYNATGKHSASGSYYFAFGFHPETKLGTLVKM
jgi:hypothetical protein